MNPLCYFCRNEVKPNQSRNDHHIVYKSLGGTRTAAAHRDCHVAHHSASGNFREWGKIGGQLSAMTKQWAFNLKHVKDALLYEAARAYHKAMYAE